VDLFVCADPGMDYSKIPKEILADLPGSGAADYLK